MFLGVLAVPEAKVSVSLTSFPNFPWGCPKRKGASIQLEWWPSHSRVNVLLRLGEVLCEAMGDLNLNTIQGTEMLSLVSEEL